MKQVLVFVEILPVIFCYCGYICAETEFCKKYLELSKINGYVFKAVIFAGWIIISIVNNIVYVPYIVIAILNHIFFIGAVLILFQGGIEKKLSVASVLVAVTTLAGGFWDSFCSCLILFLMHIAGNIQEPFLNEWENCLVICSRYVIEIIIIYFFMSKWLISVFYTRIVKWNIIIAVPLLMVVIVSDIADWGASNGILTRPGENMGLYYNQVFSHAGVCVFKALSMCIVITCILGINMVYLEQRKSSQYYSQIAVYKMLEEQHSQQERLRHDMKNHIIALSGLFENKEWDKMGIYLKTMEDNVQFSFCGDITGNRAVDAVLCQKQKMAASKNIVWECDVDIPRKCCINEFDLCVLFGNILDNALEACEKLNCGEYRFINIQAKVIKKCFLLEARNSTDLKNKHEIIFTSKENKQEHGIGLLNIKDVADSYNGVMETRLEKGVIAVSVLIPLNNTTYNIKKAF